MFAINQNTQFPVNHFSFLLCSNGEPRRNPKLYRNQHDEDNAEIRWRQAIHGEGSHSDGVRRTEVLPRRHHRFGEHRDPSAKRVRLRSWPCHPLLREKPESPLDTPSVDCTSFIWTSSGVDFGWRERREHRWAG